MLGAYRFPSPARTHFTMPTRDRDLRAALHRSELAVFRDDPGSRVVEEMGICAGGFRIDVAVVNGALHGYEIKSDRDTLARLPHQAEAYGRVFDTVTVVAGASRLEEAMRMVPAWWGVMVAAHRGGAVTVRTLRPADRNPAPDPLSVAKLLWRDEVVALLRECGAPARLLRAPRWELWPALVERLEPAELARRVRGVLEERTEWRKR